MISDGRYQSSTFGSNPLDIRHFCTNDGKHYFTLPIHVYTIVCQIKKEVALKTLAITKNHLPSQKDDTVDIYVDHFATFTTIF